ncbi:lysophospholipase L1-like esterase [Paenibacillus endophyticus]|uniref:Lysophospholipase L1-like esterase n=1 Tax=Paenibacillus endophyticus TaxID=1294268 RepID=A0A7W5C478_9BACL|nr:SGNH/GDSL hydrolase family protein [Paenibacillus endophyticus]MBB3150933.1 lysophospholipase L1-like esterase [Paenibacillus endophyticus]
MLKEWTSLTALSSAANFMWRPEHKTTITFRTYIRPREFGQLPIKLWHSNTVDSTWADGSESRANDHGGRWRIEQCVVADGGPLPDGSMIAGSERTLTFEGETSRNVEQGEQFWSDSVTVHIPDQHFLAFSWTITIDGPMNGLPYNTESLLASAYEAEGGHAAQAAGEGFVPAGNRQVLPSLLVYKKPVSKHIVFLGDSITQGVRTEQDGYAFWAAKIAAGLGPEVGVWNIGSGWSRAYDLTNESAWLSKAKQGDEVVICLGVNDIGTANRSAEQLVADLRSVIKQLQSNKPGCKLWLCTLPAFNFEGGQEIVWRTVNDWIRHTAADSVSGIFDIAKVLGQPEPQDQLVQAAYMSPNNDPHPNGLAGTAVADAFLAWYKGQNSEFVSSD